MVSSTEVAAGSRTGMPVSGSDMRLYMDLVGALCEPPEPGSVPIRTGVGSVPQLACEAPSQDALLGVQAVFRLVEYYRLRAVDHIVRDLLTAMGGQAVHEDGIRLSARHQPGIDLVALEQIVPTVAVAVAHRHPGVGDAAVIALDRLLGIPAHPDIGWRRLDPVHQPLLRLELGRGGDAQAELEAVGGMHPRRQHIVGIARPGHGLAADRAAMLLEGHNIGQHLAGMRAMGQAVDHRHGRMLRELEQHVVIERADHDAVDIAREHARGVSNRLAAAELHLLAGERDRLAAELAHGDIEGDARAGRRAIEDHGQRLALERRLAGGAFALETHFHGAARLDHAAQILRADIAEIDKMTDGGAHPARPCWLACRSLSLIQARSSRRAASAISLSDTISGGTSRTTLSPAATVISFSARSSSTRSPFGTTARRPTRSPSPRTSATTVGKRSLISASLCLSSRPQWRTCSRKPSASTTSSTACAAAIASGLPPKVEPWVPAVMPLPAAAVARQAPSGKPPPSALASAMMSGTAPVR